MCWIMLNDGFLSAVKDSFTPGNVLVRARRRKDLESVFPDRVSEIFVVPESDYAVRISISKKDFATLLVERVFDIEYTNFKKSVKDPVLHNFYTNVWYSGLFMQYDSKVIDTWYEDDLSWEPKGHYQKEEITS